MKIQRDSKGQPFIEWAQGATGFKRAWIQRKMGSDKDWAGTPEGRYLNVVRIEALGTGPREMRRTSRFLANCLMSKS
jgi:hypothetical protein